MEVVIEHKLIFRKFWPLLRYIFTKKIYYDRHEDYLIKSKWIAYGIEDQERVLQIKQELDLCISHQFQGKKLY